MDNAHTKFHCQNSKIDWDMSVSITQCKRTLLPTLHMPVSQIKYKIITEKALKPDTFKNFKGYLFDTFQEDAKMLANSFIGELGRKYSKINHGFTCADYDTAMCCWTSAMAEQRHVTIDHYNEIFLIREPTCERIFSDNTSINRFVVSEAILKCLQLIEACHGNDSKLYGYNTDGILIILKYYSKTRKT